MTDQQPAAETAAEILRRFQSQAHFGSHIKLVDFIAGGIQSEREAVANKVEHGEPYVNYSNGGELGPVVTRNEFWRWRSAMAAEIRKESA